MNQEIHPARAIIALKSAGASDDQLRKAAYALIHKTSAPPKGYLRAGTLAEYVDKVAGGVP